MHYMLVREFAEGEKFFEYIDLRIRNKSIIINKRGWSECNTDMKNESLLNII